MNDSRLKTVVVPNMNVLAATVPTGEAPGVPFGTPAAVQVFGNDPNDPKRVMLRNVSAGTVIYVAFESVSLTAQPIGGNVYELPPGISDIFSVAPNQKMYAIADGNGGRLSVHISDALPIDLPKK